MNGGDRRALLEQRAEAVRSRLERRLDALDERRDRVLALARRATRPPLNVLLIGTASVVVVALLVHQLRQRSRREHSFAGALFAPPPKPDGFVVRALKRAALSFLASLAQRASARGLERLLPEPAADRHLPEVPRPEGY